MIFAQYKIKMLYILKNMYIFGRLDEVSDIRKPKIMMFSITDSQIFFINFIISTTTKQYTENFSSILSLNLNLYLLYLLFKEHGG